jgi:hypothetical protein
MKQKSSNHARIYTNHLVSLAEDELITWESLARACLGYMSEHDTKQLAEDEFEVEEGDIA